MIFKPDVGINGGMIDGPSDDGGEGISVEVAETVAGNGPNHIPAILESLIHMLMGQTRRCGIVLGLKCG